MNLHVRPSHVIVITIAALALIFGTAAGGAVAGAKWIDGKRIEKNSIPADRLKKATITNKQLKKRSIGTSSLARDTVDDLTQTVVYTDHTFEVPRVSPDKWVAATCPADTQAVGGYMKPGNTAYAFFSDSYVDPEENAFMARVGGAQTDGQVTIQTICLR